MVAAIEGFAPRGVGDAPAAFARSVVARAGPDSVNRARAFLFAASRLAAFGEQVGLPLEAGVLLHPSLIERFVLVGTTGYSTATVCTLATNLRALSASISPDAARSRLSRRHAKPPYSPGEIAGYLALADAQPTESRRRRAGALVCLGAGAGLTGGDLKGVRGTDVHVRSGGVVVEVPGGRHPRVVPVLARFHARLVDAADGAGDRFVIGGEHPARRNVTTPLTSSLAGGSGLARIDLGRLRATWLVEVATALGISAFLAAAGITTSQYLGDRVAGAPPQGEAAVVALLGGAR